MSHVVSTDGTKIVYDRAGSGPSLILVDGALCSRGFGPSREFASALSSRFTVFTYDRRGRGESGDTKPASKQREIEDLAALNDAAGGNASVVGFSSGGALALEAAAAGVPVRSVVAYETPYVHAATAGDVPDHQQHLDRLIASGDRGGAVAYFMRDMVGAPRIAVVMMRLMPWIWGKLKAVAHTLPYDAAVMGDFRVPASRFGLITTPTLVMHGSKTDERLKAAARAVASAIPTSQHRELERQNHQVKAAALAPVIIEFCGG